MEELTCRPIGFLRSQNSTKFDTASQPELVVAPASESMVELLADSQFEAALEDLSGFTRIWLIWWFHKNNNWRPKILPPRGRTGRKGLFSTRTPHRPNPIAISTVALHRVEGRRLYIGEHDLLDGTPILDIKPYIPRFDAFPEERRGWFEAVEKHEPSFTVSTTPRAQEQLDWLEVHHHPGFGSRVKTMLADDPWPHRTRRIRPYPAGGYRLASGSWRVIFTIVEQSVTILQVHSLFTLDSVPGADEETRIHTDFLSRPWAVE